MRNEPMQYDNILYNEVVYQLEQNWNRKLTEHEVEILKFGYRYGRKVESENEIYRR